MPQISFGQRKKLFVGIGLVAVVGLLFGLNIFRLNQKDVLDVKIAAVEKAPIVANVFASGKVVVHDQEEITTRVNGIVQDIKVKGGDQVKAGQVLLQFDNSDLSLEADQAEASLSAARAQAELQEKSQSEAGLQQAKLAYENARAKLDRSRQLYEAGAISLEQLEAAQLEAGVKKSQYESALTQLRVTRQSAAASVKQADAAWKLAETRLSAAQILAPRDGTILARNAEKGQFVAMGTPVFTIGSLNNLEVESEISEVDIQRLALGQTVEISGESLGTAKFKGRVKEIAPRAESKQKSQGEQTTVMITVEVLGETGLLRPGYNVDLNITTASRKSALVVPYEAVVEDGDGNAVFVVQDGAARKRLVKTGISDDLHVEILEGLSVNDRVILNPSETLKDGATVQVND